MSILGKFREAMAEAKAERPALAAVWYDDEGTPDAGTWWWAVEHLGHPAFYLRALLAGDFAPGRRPTPRHVATLKGKQCPEGKRVTCGTCRKVPAADDLEPVERSTHDRGFLDAFRTRRMKWPRPTAPVSCWLCSDREAELQGVETPGGRAQACAGCAPYLKRRK